jgi:quercetin dioxygenase-like cupin family protein
MKIAHIKDFTNGWFIGDFEPSLLKTPQFEVAHHFYPTGFIGTPHTHKIATEYNYIVNGRISVDGNILKTGDIFIYEPGDIADVKFLDDTNLIIVKTPSIPNDKYNIITKC